MTAAFQKREPWRIAGQSDAGLVRSGNEDAFFCDAARGRFAAVADGVGGLEYGERASAEAVALVRNFFETLSVPAASCPDFAALFRKIDAEISRLGEKLVPGFGIATTLDVVADGGNGVAHCAHVGDSGIFLLRGNALSKLSEEHTLAAEEIARGNRDFPAAYGNTLTRALGIGTEAAPQVFSFETRPGDRILLATDGVTRMVPSEKIREIVAVPAAGPEAVAAALIRAANEAGGADNATAVLIFV